MKHVTLSAIILAKDAEDVIDDCLKSVAFCDEIIVVDEASHDKTTIIAKRHNALITKGIPSDFAESRNNGLKKASGEWVLYVDSDERVSQDLARNISAAIVSNVYAAYRIQRKNFYLGNHEQVKVELLERLFCKKNLQKWYGKLHETAKINGKIATLDGFLLHYTHRDLASMLAKTILWSRTEAELRFAAHHPKIVTWRLVRVMITGFWNSYIIQSGWRSGTAGLIEGIFQSYSMLITYARLWEMQEKKA